MMAKYARLAMYPGLVAAALAVLLIGANASSHAAEFDPDNSLLVSTRSELRICLDAHGMVDTEQAATRLTAAVGTVRGHSHWGPAGYGGVPRIERDCATTLPDRLVRGEVLGPGVTAEPSPYRTVVVVLDDATADRYLAGQPAVLLPYELMKVGDHVTATVSQAVAVRASFLDDPAFAAEYLTPGMGLDPALR